MSLGHKLGTAASLVAHGRFGLLQRQSRRCWREHRLRTAGDRPFVHRTAGFPLVCFPDLPDSASQYVEGGDDPWELSLLRTWLEPGDAFIDAGANLALYTHAVAYRFRGGVDILALEASPELVARLARSITLLAEKRVHAVAAVVGDRGGDAIFHVAKSEESTVSQSLAIAAAAAGQYESRRLSMLTLAQLSSAYLGARVPAAVKLDIEGAEPLALAGAPAAWLNGNGTLWLVELHPAALARLHCTVDAVIDHFSPGEYERWLLPKYPFAESEARLRPLAAGEAFTDAPFYNLIAVPLGSAPAPRRRRLQALLP